MRRSVRLATAVVSLFVLGVVTALPAGADFTVSPGGASGSPTECGRQSGTGSVTPGLGTTPKNQVISATILISSCVDAGPGVTSGTAKVTIKEASATCSSFGKKGLKSPITEKITWNTKDTSSLNGFITNGPKPGQATIKFAITAGSGKGHIGQTLVALAGTPTTGKTCTNASPIKKVTFADKDWLHFT